MTKYTVVDGSLLYARNGDYTVHCMDSRWVVLEHVEREENGAPYLLPLGRDTLMAAVKSGVVEVKEV